MSCCSGCDLTVVQSLDMRHIIQPCVWPSHVCLPLRMVVFSVVLSRWLLFAHQSWDPCPRKRGSHAPREAVVFLFFVLAEVQCSTKSFLSSLYVCVVVCVPSFCFMITQGFVQSCVCFLARLQLLNWYFSGMHAFCLCERVLDVSYASRFVAHRVRRSLAPLLHSARAPLDPAQVARAPSANRRCDLRGACVSTGVGWFRVFCYSQRFASFEQVLRKMLCVTPCSVSLASCTSS